MIKQDIQKYDVPPTSLGTHEGCGGVVMSAHFASGVDQYCTKCGNFGVDRTPLASPFRTVNLIAISYQNEFTCSADCLVKDPSDGVECRDAIARAQKLSPIDMIDEVLVVMNSEVVYQHGGQDGFHKKQTKVA